jgi:hypothetical protein
MRFDTRALPMVRLLARPAAPDGGPTAGPTAVVVVSDGWVAHRVTLTVAKFQGTSSGKDER